MSHVIEPSSTTEALSLLSDNKMPVLVDFFASWCGPCRALSPVLDDFASERAGSVKVVKLDVDKFTDISGQVGIRSVPTLMLVRDGQVVAAQAGSLSKSALAAFVDSALT